MHDVAGDANGGARVLADLADFTALQPDDDMLPSHHLGAIVARLFLLGDDGRIGPRAAAEDCTAVVLGTDVVHHRADRDHVHRQAVPAPGRPRCQNTGIDDAAHAVQQVLWNAGAIALHHIAGTHALGGHNVALVARRLLRQEGNVRAPARVVLDALDRVWPRSPPLEINGANPPLVATTAMPDGDAPAVVPAAFPVALFGNGQGQVRSALPQVVVDRPFEMSKTRRPRFVRPHFNSLGFRRHCCRGAKVGAGAARCVLGPALRLAGEVPDRIEAESSLTQRNEEGRAGGQGPEPRLQHDGRRRGWGKTERSPDIQQRELVSAGNIEV